MPRAGDEDAPDEAADGSAMMEESKGSRLDTVKERGTVICASRNDVPGYGSLDSAGNNVGFDIDLCRALATAVLGDPSAIEIRLITAAERGPTIQSGEVDMLVRTVTWTTSRDAQWGNYAQTMFYDGQGFMVQKSLGISSALELEGADGLRDSGHDNRAEPAGLLQPERPEHRGVDLRRHRRSGCRLPGRASATPSLTTAPSWPLSAARSTTGATTSSCLRRSPKSLLAPWSPTATISGSTSSRPSWACSYTPRPTE